MFFFPVKEFCDVVSDAQFHPVGLFEAEAEEVDGKELANEDELQEAHEEVAEPRHQEERGEDEATKRKRRKNRKWIGEEIGRASCRERV